MSNILYSRVQSVSPPSGHRSQKAIRKNRRDGSPGPSSSISQSLSFPISLHHFLSLSFSLQPLHSCTPALCESSPAFPPFACHTYAFQQEAWALWHEGESDEGGDGREGTHQHKHPPAVERELCAHAEAPAQDEYKHRVTVAIEWVMVNVVLEWIMASVVLESHRSLEQAC